MQPDLGTLGKRIRHERKRQGLRLEDLAHKAELSKGFLSDVENDKRDIATKNLLRISDVLNVSVDWLARGQMKKKKVKCPMCKGTGKIEM